MALFVLSLHVPRVETLQFNFSFKGLWIIIIISELYKWNNPKADFVGINTL